MKQANVPAVSRFVDSAAVERYFDHEGHRTVVSQRALQVHTDPLLGYTSIDGVGYVVSEISPYEADLDWDSLTEPAQMTVVVKELGRATAKVHCASDEDSEQSLVNVPDRGGDLRRARGPPQGVRRRPHRLRDRLRRLGAQGSRAVRRRPSGRAASAASALT